MKVIFASDHRGFDLKGKLIPFVQSLGHQTEDAGPFSYNPSDDYPDFISLAAKKISMDPTNFLGILIGGSGRGEAMVANRFPRVRAAVYYGGKDRILTLSREHNDANALSLGARFLSEEDAKHSIEVWLSAKFTGEERHVRRIAQIDTLTK